MYIAKREYGYSRVTQWLNGDESAYNNAVETWNARAKSFQGRRRKEIHASWGVYVKYFDPTNPIQSQGAFCRWAGMQPSSLSAAKLKQITARLELLISEWIEELQKLER